jgi:hypothetical protein
VIVLGFGTSAGASDLPWLWDARYCSIRLLGMERLSHGSGRLGRVSSVGFTFAVDCVVIERAC